MSLRMMTRLAASWIAVVWLLVTAGARAVPGRVALLHLNPNLTELESNIALLNTMVGQAFESGANIVVTPELATTGYCLTRQQVIDQLGLTEPYPELATIRDLAVAHQGYVFVGLAEVTPEGGVLNAVAIFGPSGYIRSQAKRSLPLWHDRGTTPIEPITTPYGDIGVLICSDSYLPDMTRIATLSGADLLVLPANWWGSYEQDQIWQVRARENGIWYFVANRWGEEVDDRYSPPYVYNMNDAPSVVVDPNGNLLQNHRAQDDAVPHNTILYQDIDIPSYRIGNALTQTYSVIMREPGAYGELANLYYRRDIGHVEYPGLPDPGVVRVASMAYRPDPTNNLSTIRNIWSNSHEQTADVLVLPGLGVSVLPVDTGNPNWSASRPWSQLRSFVEANGISLLVTSVLERPGQDGVPESLLLVRPGQPPELHRQVHDSFTARGTGQSPVTVDLTHARVGVLLGRDALFPEAVTQLAKSGADMVVITSTVGMEQPPEPLSEINYMADIATLRRTWKVRSNDGVHVTAADWTGTGMIVDNGGGYINQTLDANSTTPLAVLNLDSSLVRFKYLNAYESWDVATLLGQ